MRTRLLLDVLASRRQVRRGIRRARGAVAALRAAGHTAGRSHALDRSIRDLGLLASMDGSLAVSARLLWPLRPDDPELAPLLAAAPLAPLQRRVLTARLRGVPWHDLVAAEGTDLGTASRALRTAADWLRDTLRVGDALAAGATDLGAVARSLGISRRRVNAIAARAAGVAAGRGGVRATGRAARRGAPPGGPQGAPWGPPRGAAGGAPRGAPPGAPRGAPPGAPRGAPPGGPQGAPGGAGAGERCMVGQTHPGEGVASRRPVCPAAVPAVAGCGTPGRVAEPCRPTAAPPSHPPSAPVVSGPPASRAGPSRGGSAHGPEPPGSAGVRTDRVATNGPNGAGVAEPCPGDASPTSPEALRPLWYVLAVRPGWALRVKIDVEEQLPGVERCIVLCPDGGGAARSGRPASQMSYVAVRAHLDPALVAGLRRREGVLGFTGLVRGGSGAAADLPPEVPERDLQAFLHRWDLAAAAARGARQPSGQWPAARRSAPGQPASARPVLDARGSREAPRAQERREGGSPR